MTNATVLPCSSRLQAVLLVYLSWQANAVQRIRHLAPRLSDAALLVLEQKDTIKQVQLQGCTKAGSSENSLQV